MPRFIENNKMSNTYMYIDIITPAKETFVGVEMVTGIVPQVRMYFIN